jgi:hypothetical protein
MSALKFFRSRLVRMFIEKMTYKQACNETGFASDG